MTYPGFTTTPSGVFKLTTRGTRMLSTRASALDVRRDQPPEMERKGEACEYARRLSPSPLPPPPPPTPPLLQPLPTSTKRSLPLHPSSWLVIHPRTYPLFDLPAPDNLPPRVTSQPLARGSRWRWMIPSGVSRTTHPPTPNPLGPSQLPQLIPSNRSSWHTGDKRQKSLISPR